ncbi:condensation domain-containing protein [Pedobacter sp. NJ-S-72]
MALELALQMIVNRHEVLRSVIREQDGIAYQQVLKADQWKLSIFNKEAGFNQELLVKEFIDRPFDLSADAMLRAGLFQVTADEALLVIVMHHIASDGWSLSVIVKELSVLYDAYIKDTTPDLAPMAIQFADYAIWQKTYISGDLLHKQQAYWKKNNLQGWNLCS